MTIHCEPEGSINGFLTKPRRASILYDRKFGALLPESSEIRIESISLSIQFGSTKLARIFGLKSFESKVSGLRHEKWRVYRLFQAERFNRRPPKVGTELHKIDNFKKDKQ